MYMMPNGIFHKILEVVILFVVVVVLIRVGIGALSDVIGWIIAIPAIIIGIRIAWRVYKHHHDTHDF